MPEWINSINWEFVIGDIIIPISLFLAGFLIGENVERRKYKAKSKIKGSYNNVSQNNEYH